MTRTRNYSSWAYWMLRLRDTELEYPFPVDEPDAYPDARDRVRRVLAESMGVRPTPVDPRFEVLDSVDVGSYRRDHVVFDSEAAMSVPAYLLVPHDRVAPGPAVLACHGHGPGKDAVCGVAASEYGDDYAHELASAGFVVLAPDLRGFGERAEAYPDDREWCNAQYVSATVAGVNAFACNLWDLQCSLDVLGAQPLVDPSAIGMIGFSYGGTCTLFLAALDERVRAAVVSGAFSHLRRAHTVPGNLCGSQVFADMLRRLDHVDLGALIAPRPLRVENGTEDVLWSAGGATAEIERLRRVYVHEGAADRLEQHVFSGDHRYDGEGVVPFFERNLAQ